jgi:choline kinase
MSCFTRAFCCRSLRTRADLSIIIDREFREETSKVTIRDGRVISLSKSISHYDFSGTFVNIANFSARGNRLIFATIDALLQEGQTHLVFNDALGRLSTRGVAIRFTETQGLPWAEIDDANDLYYAQAVVYPALKRETVFCKVVTFPSKTSLPADPRPAA